MSPDTPAIPKAITPYDKYQENITCYESDREHTNVYQCSGLTYTYFKSDQDNISKVCNTVLSFLNDLKVHNDYNYRDNGCKYLFYWLYSKTIDSETSFERVLDFMKKLNNIFNEHYDGLHKLDIYINQMNKDAFDKLKKIINLYDVFNTYIIKLKPPYNSVDCCSECIDLFVSYANECRQKYDFFFFNELKDFREQYNTFTDKVISCKGEQRLLPPLEFFNTVHVIVIPSFMILLTSFAFPLLYRFTAFGPWMRRLIGRDKKMLYDINEETDHSLSTYDVENNDSKIRSYNIAYNSS
ncbi:PIR Superfamily Protein [Plasmodium ovale wallikeri]|uniref:PIR Superfamily Protein n=1 Tax=Plasmodium ovale wallikeri TaxID=864142 RepID=A0A1A9AFT4_PLAOA|nr:PIR Superfamily Protein [Plasmodium ovale wallikeri]